MRRTFYRSVFHLAIGLTLLVVAGKLDSGRAMQAQAGGLLRRTPTELFANEYVAPTGPNAVGAAMYPSPRPTPPVVGQTYITYQALMPEEFLYRHHRVYKTPHEDGSRTRTSVHWR